MRVAAFKPLERLLTTLLVSTALITTAYADAPAVLVKTIQPQALAEPYQAVGRVEATDTVNIIARVGGILEQRLFIEGSYVKAGQVLFEIEKEPYQIAIKQQKANLAGAKASLKQAEAELSRSRQLRKSGAMSKAEFEVTEAKRDQLKAQVMLAEAGLQQAELNLSYTTIKSPISGKIGQAQFNPGNLIKANGDDPLATIVNTDPVYVEMAISDKLLLDLRKDGPIDTSSAVPRLLLADGTLYSHQGTFNFIDPQVSRDTDTITIRTSFPNPEGVLMPGQFVRLHFTPKDIPEVLAVPQSAVQRDRQGTFVMVVKSDNSVEQKRVALDEQVQGQWIVISGVNNGDRVVVEGLQKVRAGITVSASEVQSPDIQRSMNP